MMIFMWGRPLCQRIRLEARDSDRCYLKKLENEISKLIVEPNII